MGILVRKSARLHVAASTSANAPTSPMNEPIPQPLHLMDLLDLDVRVPIVPLPPMEDEFNPDFLESQEQREYTSRSDCSSNEPSDADNFDDSDEDDVVRGGGLEYNLWPLELLQQAYNYGLRQHRKQVRDREGRGEDSDGASARDDGDLHNRKALLEAMLRSDRSIWGNYHVNASTNTMGALGDGDDGDGVPSHPTSIRVRCGWGHLSLDPGDGDGDCRGLGNGVCV